MSRHPRSFRRAAHAACSLGWTALLFLVAVSPSSAAEPSAILQQTGLDQVPVWTAPHVNVERLLAEDEANVGRPVPYRIGTALEVGLTPADSGTWHREDGRRVWRVVLHSPGAHWLAPAFDRVHLEPGAEIWLYDPEWRIRRGPFTQADVIDGRMGFLPIEGDTLVVEIDWPADTPVSKLDAYLGRVFHGYRSWTGVGADACSDNAGSCHFDVNCPLGDNWQDEKRGVVKLYIPDLRTGFDAALCSGSLINNTALDCKPYVLTANHCFTSNSDVAHTQFLVHYERPGCGPGSASEVLLGTNALLRGFNTITDFRLLEVGVVSPTEGLYFNGWSRFPVPPPASYAIHHPAGAPKRISHSALTLVPGDGNPYPENQWRVVRWEQGVVDNGSSGSPLFDPAGRIIGQLTSGASACDGSQPNGDGDNFGRLDVSWDIHPTLPRLRLKDWLDPTGSDVSFLNGMDQSFCGDDPQAKLVHSGNIVDENQGNRDGILDPGDIAQLQVQLTNIGPAAAGSEGEGTIGTLSLADPPEDQVTLLVDEADWPRMNSGLIANSAAPHFTIDLDGDRLCGKSIRFRIEAESDVSTFLVTTGAPTGYVQPFEDDMESGTDGWTVSPAGSWLQSTATSAPGGGTTSWHVPDTGSAATESILSMPSYGSLSVLPELAAFTGLPPRFVLRFEHYLNSACGRDGGVLEYSLDGSTWLDAGPLIVEGGYNSVILPSTSGELAGREGWSGDLGAWSTVRVDFSAFEGVPDLHLQWRFATDSGSGSVGWYLDNVAMEVPVLECARPHRRLVPGAFCRGHLGKSPWPMTLCGAEPGRSSGRR